MSEKIKLDIDVLEWAANRAHSTFYDLSFRNFKNNLNAVSRGYFTIDQIKYYSKITHIPFGFLFFKKIPFESCMHKIFRILLKKIKIFICKNYDTRRKNYYQFF